MIRTTTSHAGRTGARATLARLHHDENGLLSAVNLVTLTMIMVLLVTITNVGHVTHQKIKMQGTADAVAISAGAMQARSMNAITATNHVIGEMAALVIIHEAVGGKALDNNDPNEEATASEDEALDLAYSAATAAGATTPAYETVRQKGGIYAERTLLDTKKVLKKYLTWCYWQKAAAKAMEASKIPPVVAAGVALEKSMNLFERVIGNEYNILNAWHEIARSLLPLKRIIRDELMPNAKNYTNTVVEAAPKLAQATAEEIARMNGFQGTLFPVDPALPVVIDPLAKAQTLPSSYAMHPEWKRPPCPCDRVAINRLQIVKVTQLARASFPWVNYHRQAILDVLGPLLPLCRAKQFYFDESNDASICVCDKLQMQKEMGLYVLKGYLPPDKGYEKWTDNSTLADELFCTLGLVYRDPPTVYGQSATHRDGMIAYAQVMIYNASEQQRPEFHIDLTCKRIIPIRQANCGWDTLNWLSGSRQQQGDPVANPPNADGDPKENRPFELVGIGLPSEFPQIKVNWQAKLTPATVTRLGDLRRAATGGGRFGGLPQPYAAVAAKLLEKVPGSLRTH
jgi:hypothetical protein